MSLRWLSITSCIGALVYKISGGDDDATNKAIVYTFMAMVTLSRTFPPQQERQGPMQAIGELWHQNQPDDLRDSGAQQHQAQQNM